MSKKKRLTNIDANIDKGSRLTDTRQKGLFKFCIERCLDNRYSFAKLKPEAIRILDRFIADTVGRQMTISQVESEFLRTKGKVSEREIIAGVEREIFHLGKDRNKFRIFGYYNEDGYFVIHRIDPKHQYHKE